MIRVTHPDGGAIVFAFEKREYFPDADGIIEIPNAALPSATAAGFVVAPSPEEVAALKAEAELRRAADVPGGGDGDRRADATPGAEEPVLDGAVTPAELAAEAELTETPVAVRPMRPFRAPPEIQSPSFAGMTIEIPPDRIVDIPVEHAEAAIALGFVALTD